MEKFRDARIMAFTKTWLTPVDPDTSLTLSGFAADGA